MLILVVVVVVAGLVTLRESEAAAAARDSCVERVKQEISGSGHTGKLALAAARARLEACQ